MDDKMVIFRDEDTLSIEEFDAGDACPKEYQSDEEKQEYGNENERI